MSKPKFTPGPWRWSDEFRTQDDRETSSLLGQGGYGVLSCDGLRNSPSGDDARLIAAAPQMYRALQDAEWALANDGDGLNTEQTKALNVIRAALAAAEGREDGKGGAG